MKVELENRPLLSHLQPQSAIAPRTIPRAIAIPKLIYKLSDQKGQAMPVNWREHIVSTPGVLRGKPRIKGTRIPVSLILGYLASGHPVEYIISEFPDLVEAQIAACLDYARDLSDFEIVA